MGSNAWFRRWKDYVFPGRQAKARTTGRHVAAKGAAGGSQKTKPVCRPGDDRHRSSDYQGHFAAPGQVETQADDGARNRPNRRSLKQLCIAARAEARRPASGCPANSMNSITMNACSPPRPVMMTSGTRSVRLCRIASSPAFSASNIGSNAARFNLTKNRYLPSSSR